MDSIFVAHFLNGLFMVGLPIVLGMFLTRRFQLGWALWWIGAAGFVLSQVGHIPFNFMATLLFQRGILPLPPPSWQPYFNPIFLGLSSGLWEELTRWTIYRFWASDARSWKRGVLLGAGHGGAEAIIFGLLVLVTFAYMAALRSGELGTLVPPAQADLARQQITAYWSVPWYMALLGALERALTIPIHICLSVLVLQAFVRRQPAWVAAAVGWHALLNGLIVYFAGAWTGQPWNAYALEGVIAIFTLISIGIVFALRQPEPEAEVEEESHAEPAGPVSLASLEDRPITPEDLDRSRFSNG